MEVLFAVQQTNGNLLKGVIQMLCHVLCRIYAAMLSPSAAESHTKVGKSPLEVSFDGSIYK